jgi:hypothetical protein
LNREATGASKGKENDTAVEPRPIERPDQSSFLRDLNERNRAFYEEQSRKLDENLDETTWKIALNQRESEAARGIPINNWSFDRAVADAAKARALVRSEQGRSAGRAPKTDALQRLILQLARTRPQMTQKELLARLKEMESGGVIDDIDGYEVRKPYIHFSQDGRSKSAPISGLKDRLRRAKKMITSARAETR